MLKGKGKEMKLSLFFNWAQWN